jgi:hypothetical protein
MKDCFITDINLLLNLTYIHTLLYLLVGPEFELQDDVRNQLKQEMPQLLTVQSSFLR